jgi:hypothetical protein
MLQLTLTVHVPVCQYRRHEIVAAAALDDHLEAIKSTMRMSNRRQRPEVRGDYLRNTQAVPGFPRQRV